MITTVLVAAVLLVAAWYFVRASVFVALAALLATTFLVPGSVLLPGATSTYATVHRLLLALFVLNILSKVVRGDVAATVLQPTRLTWALGLWVSLTFAIGVAMAETTYAVGSAVFLWIFVVEYAVFFYFVTAAIRIVGDPWRVATLVVALIAVAAGVAVYEHISGVSFGRWLARTIHSPDLRRVFDLGERGGEVRVQAGFDFALAYGSAGAILAPLAIVVASRAKNILLRIAPALLLLSIAWTYTRSAYAGVAIGVTLLILTSRLDRRVFGYVLVGALAVASFALATSAYSRTFASQEGEGSSVVREERLPIILSNAAERPLTGKGLGSVAIEGFRTTDSVFLLTYAEIGVLGVAGLTLLLVAGTVWAARGLRATGRDRLIAAAVVPGMLLGIWAGAFVDAFTVSGLTRTYWLVAALGTVVSERTKPRVWGRPRLLLRASMPVIAVLVGIGLATFAPSSATTTLRFTTRAPFDEAAAENISPFADQIVLNSTCEILEARIEVFGHKVQCFDVQTAVGVGEVRIEAPTREAVQRDIRVAVAVVRRHLRTVRFYGVQSADRIRPTWVKTAPVWMGLAGSAIALMVPPVARRRPRLGSGGVPTPNPSPA